MNESAGDQITEALGNHLELTETDNLDSTDDADDQQPAADGREGLPRTFRMRHDAHYVDELMSRAADGPARDREPLARRAAPPPPERVATRDTIDKAHESAGPALGLIADRLESIAALTGTLRTHASSSTFIEQSVQVEFVRVTRLARAAAILQRHESPAHEQVSAQEIADEVSRAAALVTRLAGMEFDVSVDDPAFAILAEPAMVIQGIVGTVDAIVDLLQSNPRRPSARAARPAAARISISLQSVTVRPAIILDVFCPTLTISSGHAERFFQNADDDYRAAPAAGVLIAAAAHVVRAHGGRADIKQHGAGSTITYVFPQTP